MALPATETFTASDSTQVSALTNWSAVHNELDIYSNAAAPDTSGDECAARWNADSFDNDQYAECTLVESVASPSYAIGPAVRCASGAANYYGWYANGEDSYLFIVVSGFWTQIGTTGAGLSSDDVMKIEANGTTITGYVNDAESKSGTNSGLSSGYAGICGYNDTTNDRIDDWEGGNLGGVVSVSAKSNHYARLRSA